ncbi:MAG: acyl carrier protein [Alphaproteobacteria bacterium]|nr:acyl carrier protein [Alphaproteobacteria bacterium]
MTKEEFLNELTAIAGTTKKISEKTLLADIPEWDSLAAMSTVSFFEEKLKKEIDLGTIEQMKTVSDLMKAAGL